MKLSMKSRYAFRALADLSIHSKSAHVPLNVLAQRMGYRRSFWSRFSQAFEEPELSEASKDRREGIILHVRLLR